MREKFSKSALFASVFLILSTEHISHDAQMLMDPKSAMCYMLKKAREDKKEMLMFFACNQKACLFVKSKTRGKTYTIKINQNEMAKAFAYLQSVLKGDHINYGFAHTHPNYTAKKAILVHFNCHKNTNGKVCTKLKRRLSNTKYLSIPPSVIDLNTQLYLVSSYGMPFSSIVVDPYYAWLVYFKPDPYLAVSPDEYALTQDSYKKYERRIGELLASALKNSKNLAPNVANYLNDAISRLSLHIEQIRVDALCKK